MVNAKYAYQEENLHSNIPPPGHIVHLQDLAARGMAIDKSHVGKLEMEFAN